MSSFVQFWILRKYINAMDDDDEDVQVIGAKPTPEDPPTNS